VIIVTGGAGFIGSNLVKALNQIGREDLIVVDDLSDGSKFRNIVDCTIADYLDKDEFRQMIESGNNSFGKLDMVFHQGACSDTTEWNGRKMLDNNYSYSKQLLHYCLQDKTPFIYASSAAVYGVGDEFSEQASSEKPINVYAYSKLLFDNYVRRVMKSVDSQIVGLRYFNVYGPGEAHKGKMASVAYHLNNQLLGNTRVKLFDASDGYAAGEQQRDFIYVDDAVAINLWFMQESQHSGIFNAGTGTPRSFNDVAKAVIDWHGCGEIDYIPFPEKLRGCYQSFTKADLTQLSSVGCKYQCLTLEAGMNDYLAWLNADNS
jgi:ADP-L-glycero-D-manno-heptose 6-epimerase